MKPETHQRTHYLYPGLIFAASQPTLVCTVLGSCVSICLWDERRQTGGINHFMLPYWNGEGLALPRYGDIAIPQLVKKMESLGSHRNNLVAKVFGGARLWGSSDAIISVGQRNVDLALATLAELNIRIVGQDTGSDTGRKIYFATDTGRVYLKRNRSPAVREGKDERRVRVLPEVG